MSSKKVLFIGQDYTQTNEGLSVVTKRNLRLLEQIGFEVEQILIKAPKIKTKLKNILLWESYGYNKEVARQIKITLQKEYLFVFFDRSLFGPMVRQYSKSGNHIICFFHNVESSLAESRLKVTRSPIYWFFSRYLAWNEKKTVKNADVIISISERDQLELKERYGLKDVFLMPTSFQPALTGCLQGEIKGDPYCLFVGSDFFANQQGIRWFIKEVAPNIKLNLKVVGSICNSIEKQTLPANVKLEGYVDDLNTIYASASCVISPIFSGSGLKTKTIEALRYGKVIFGTNEAFVGIKPDLFDKIGVLCNSKEEFINAINNYSNHPVCINKGSVEVFNQYFSDAVAYRTLKSIIKDIR